MIKIKAKVIGVVALMAALFVIVVLSIFHYLLAWITGLGYPDSPGSFGDQFGGLNAAFAGLALIGIIFTLILQQTQINQQEVGLEKQDKRISFQNFVNSFFNYLSHVMKIKNEIDSDKNTESGMTLPDLFIGYLEKFAENSDNFTCENMDVFFSKIKRNRCLMKMASLMDSIYIMCRKILDEDMLDEEEKFFYLMVLLNSFNMNYHYVLHVYGFIFQYNGIVEILVKKELLCKCPEMFMKDESLDRLRDGLGFKRNPWLQTWKPKSDFCKTV